VGVFKFYVLRLVNKGMQNNSMNSKPGSNHTEDKTAHPILGADNFVFMNKDDPLLEDPEYRKLLSFSQNGEWDQCRQSLERLLEKYPDHPKLIDFRADIDLQNMKQYTKTDREGEESIWKSRIKNFLRYFVLLLGAALVIGVILFAFLSNFKSTLQSTDAVTQQQNLKNLKELELQAKAMLQIGNMELLNETLQKMEALDSTYPSLAELKGSAAELELFKSQYDRALQLMSAGNSDDALTVLQKIDQERPGLWDVKSLIGKINKDKQIQVFLYEAEKAYAEQKWGDVITAYESARTMDQNINSEKIIQQLLTSYLRDVIKTLSIENPTEKDISRAESYYRKAVALIPQSKTYIEERENLRQISLQLLILKYSQSSQRILKDPNNTEISVNLAVEYLTHASELIPNNSRLKRDLDKANLYLSGLHSFNINQWDQAITQFQTIVNFDSHYPNDMVPQLLYEAYIANGQKYYLAGFYLDARKNFEAAEVLAWQQADNPLRKFEVQLKIGATLGKLDNYQDAASYFKFAFGLIKIDPKVVNAQEISSSLTEAAALFTGGKHFEAYQRYLLLMENVDQLYKMDRVSVNAGDTLVNLANKYHSTVSAIRKANGLMDSKTIKYNEDLIIPSLP
jgi:tetratricopeptide (TPR) repeat protein